MALPLHRTTIIAAFVITLALAVAFPLYPVAAASFETGLLVGLLLHSTHTATNIECGNLNRKL